MLTTLEHDELSIVICISSILTLGKVSQRRGLPLLRGAPPEVPLQAWRWQDADGIRLHAQPHEERAQQRPHLNHEGFPGKVRRENIGIRSGSNRCNRSDAANRSSFSEGTPFLCARFRFAREK